MYIGQQPTLGAFEKQIITPDSSTTTFTLDYTSASSISLLVVNNGSVKNPLVDYTLQNGGTQIVFTSAPNTGEIVYIIYLGKQINSAALSYSTDTFSGDGSTISYTINNGRSVNDLLVFIDGSCKIPTTDYTISGTTLNFNTAPGISTTIMIRYLPIL
jgi:hypothetical protein